MSNHLISESYKRDIGGGLRKSLMAYLADKASDDGRGIYASKTTMADELGWAKNTIRANISALVDDGLLIIVGERACVNGHTVEYAINVDALTALPLVGAWQRKEDRRATGVVASPVATPPSGRTGAVAAPVQQNDRCNSDTPTRAAAAPKPPLEPIPPSDPDGSEAPAVDFDDRDRGAVILPGGGLVGESGPGIAPSPPAGVQLPPPPVSVKAHRLPDNWEPPALSELGGRAGEMARMWPDDAYLIVAEQFQMHWAAAAGATAKKLNWAAAWRKWVIGEHDKIMRAAKAGTSFKLSSSTKAAGSQSQPARPVAAKDREDDRSAGFHTVLERALGASTYRRYLKPAAILFEGGEITVIVGTDFQRSYVETNLLPGISVALARWNAPVNIVSEAKHSSSAERNNDHG